MEMFWCKVFLTKNEPVVAICDEDLIEKEIKSKKMKIKISKHFYGDRLVDEKVALRLMNKATICNLMGKKIVEIAEKNGFIAGENIIVINGIPHAQFVKI
jgi:hypothetical protein